MQDKPSLLINPVVRWAVHPGAQGTIAYVDGVADPEPLPQENAVITRPFLVDPVSRQPVPVRVVEIRRLWDASRQGHTLAVVVAREH